MKTKSLFCVFLVAIIAWFTISCSHEEPDVSDGRSRQLEKSATITFRLTGENEMILSDMSFTRALTADGKSLTDLWVIDYKNGLLAQDVLHQSSSDIDFGIPTLNLSVGSHHVYFIASRGSGAAIDTDAHTLIFSKVLDTFYKEYEISVTATTNGSRSVTLDRIVTKLTATITDAIPTGAATFNIIPATWYYGIDYLTGEPTAAATNQAITINIPASEIGKTDELLNVYGFSGSEEWTTDVTLNCKTSGGDILGTAALTDVPLKRNRITSLSGPLFSTNGLTTVSLSTDWLDAYTGTW